MPRTKRIVPVDSVFHIVCRGNNKQDVFHNDSDKLFYWHLLDKLKVENMVDIFHYCIMNNHIHLVVWITFASNLSKFMKQLNLLYFNYYCRNYDYCGHIWQGRFKSNIIQYDSYLLQCGKYIELNPVRAGIVSLPEEYEFSSYRHYAFGKPDSVITDGPCYLDLADNAADREERYRKFVIDSNIINSRSLSKQAVIGGPEV